MLMRMYIQAALFACRMGFKDGALDLTRCALIEANKIGARQSAGHLMAALNAGRRS